MPILARLYLFVRGLQTGRVPLAAENLALRHQVALFKRATPRPKLRRRDRVFWVWWSGVCSGWRSVLVLVHPETVIRWHRQGFRLYGRWKSQGDPVGRPPNLAGNSGPHPAHGPGEPAVGRPAHRRRTAIPRVPHRRFHRGQVRAAQTDAALAELARVSGQPCWSDRHHRLLHGPDGDLSRVVLLSRPPPRPASRRSLSWHGPPHPGLDGPAGRRGLPVCRGPPPLTA